MRRHKAARPARHSFRRHRVSATSIGVEESDTFRNSRYVAMIGVPFVGPPECETAKQPFSRHPDFFPPRAAAATDLRLSGFPALLAHASV